MDTTVVTLRLPSELVEWVDSVGKRGAVVAEALELMRSPKRVALTDSNTDLIRAVVRETVEQLEHGPVPQAVGPSIPSSKPSMDALRDICASHIPEKTKPVEDATPRCCECDQHLIGKAIKGRGIVWGCTYQGCPMYGLGQRTDHE